jgi:hypothetical protein
MFLSTALMTTAEASLIKIHALCDDTEDNTDEKPLRDQVYGMLKVSLF